MEDYEYNSDSGYCKKSISMSIPHNGSRRARSPSRPKYPTQHSFVVDLNNPPIYDCEKKNPKPAKRETVTDEDAPGTPHVVHQSYATTPNVPYYPPKNPYTQPPATCRRKHKPLFDCNRPIQCFLLFILIALILILYFALLGMVLENHRLIKATHQMVQEIHKDHW